MVIRLPHNTQTGQSAYDLLDKAVAQGWSSVETIPLFGQGSFMALTQFGLIRRAQNTQTERRIQSADRNGPNRTSVVSIESGNALVAIAWKRVEYRTGSTD